MKHAHILYLIHSFDIGGVERQCVELLKGIAGNPMITPHVCSFEHAPNGYTPQLEQMHIEHTVIERTRKYDLSLLSRLHAFAQSRNITLIHSFSHLAGLIAVFYGKWTGIPVVASTIRDARNDTLKTALSVKLQSLLADRFVSNSRAGFSCRFKKWKTNFHVIYNGIDENRFCIDEQAVASVKAGYDLGRFDNVIAMIASLSKYKDQETLLRSAPGVLSRKPRTVFLLVGDGTERTRLETTARDLGIADHVIFTGYCDDVLTLLANSHLSVLMTNARLIVEGVSNALLESMAMGVPVIASRGGGTDELIIHETNGILVEPFAVRELETWILKLLDSGPLRARLAGEGKKTVQATFSYKNYIRCYTDMYRDLTA